MTSFSLTSALVQKLACKDTCQGKTCQRRYLVVHVNYLSSALAKENFVVVFSIYTTKENLSGKTCQGELASLYSQQVFLDKGTCQGLTELQLWPACFSENITILRYLE